eukprot:GHVQ01016752.1.p1 GENE.GHVQ01016752.1~~GHVQ01016752.1.p1  ORF type:complete len:257 (-),score=47.59 GHVQ01016752.1:201-971(-)
MSAPTRESFTAPHATPPHPPRHSINPPLHKLAESPSASARAGGRWEGYEVVEKTLSTLGGILEALRSEESEEQQIISITNIKRELNKHKHSLHTQLHSLDTGGQQSFQKLNKRVEQCEVDKSEKENIISTLSGCGKEVGTNEGSGDELRGHEQVVDSKDEIIKLAYEIEKIRAMCQRVTDNIRLLDDKHKRYKSIHSFQMRFLEGIIPVNIIDTTDGSVSAVDERYYRLKQYYDISYEADATQQRQTRLSAAYTTR